MTVSVVIPAYNAERFIERTLASVLAQTHRDLEVVVVDDGSTDRTRQIVAAFGAPVRLASGERRGVSRARNEGVRLTAGELVAFMDHDDLWEPDKLRRQVEVLAADERAVLVFTQARAEQEGRTLEVFPRIEDPEGFLARAYENLVHWNFIPMSAVMVRREALPRPDGQEGPFDPRYELAEDWDLWLRIAAAGGPGAVAFIAEPLTRYEIVEGRATSRMADLRLEDIALFRRQVAEHPWLIASDPARCRATLSRLHEEAGYWLLREGRRAEARRRLAEAWRLRPTSLRPLGFLVASLLGRGERMPAGSS